MPHAIERSLATPMTRPRLPAISGPGRAMSVLVMTFFHSWCARAAWAQPLTILRLASLANSRAPRRCRPTEPLVPSRIASLQHQSRIGAPEAEAVRHYTVKVGIVLSFPHDGHVGELRVELVDVGALANEAVVHHKQGEDGLLHTDRA